MRASTSFRAQIQAQVGTLSLTVEFDTREGALAIVGPNGAGKTSLLATLLGARHVEAGKITVGETVLLDTATRLNVPVEERRLGYVPQDYALFPHLSVNENVLFALRSSLPGMPESERTDRARATLQSLGIASLAERRPRTLSGGERQRAALARALSVEPRALLLDEPLAALDVHARRAVRAFLAQTLERLALPTVLITHDPADARVLAQQILVLESGTVTQQGTWAELSARPATSFVEEFVATGA